MITRRHIQRCFLWAGIAIGVLGLAGYVLSLVGNFTHTWGTDRKIEVGLGGIALAWTTDDAATWMAPGSLMLEPTSSRHWRWLPTAGAKPDPRAPVITVGYAVIPYWVLVGIGAGAAYVLLPAGYPRGRCQKCGYDLKGVPDTNGAFVCPECGTTSNVS